MGSGQVKSETTGIGRAFDPVGSDRIPADQELAIGDEYFLHQQELYNRWRAQGSPLLISEAQFKKELKALGIKYEADIKKSYLRKTIDDYIASLKNEGLSASKIKSEKAYLENTFLGFGARTFKSMVEGNSAQHFAVQMNLLNFIETNKALKKAGMQVVNNFAFVDISKHKHYKKTGTVGITSPGVVGFRWNAKSKISEPIYGGNSSIYYDPTMDLAPQYLNRGLVAYKQNMGYQRIAPFGHILVHEAFHAVQYQYSQEHNGRYSNTASGRAYNKLEREAHRLSKSDVSSSASKKEGAEMTAEEFAGLAYGNTSYKTSSRYVKNPNEAFRKKMSAWVKSAGLDDIRKVNERGMDRIKKVLRITDLPYPSLSTGKPARRVGNKMLEQNVKEVPKIKARGRPKRKVAKKEEPKKKVTRKKRKVIKRKVAKKVG